MLRLRRGGRRVHVRPGDRARRLRRRRRASRGQGRDPAHVHDDRPVEGAGAAQAAGRGDGDGGRVVPPAPARRARRAAGARLPAQRGLAGDVARQFKLGWAPDDWDALAAISASPASCCATSGWRSATSATACRTRSGRGCCSRSSPTSARRWPSAAGSCPGRTTRRSTRTRRRRAIYAKSKTLYGLNWAKADIVDGRPGGRVRGLHRRDRLPPRRRAAGRGHVRHGAHRGARAAAQALRQPGRAGLRRRRRRPGRRRALLRVGAEVPGRGRRWPGFPEGKDPGELAAARSRTRWPRRSTTRCRSSGSACSGRCSAPAADTPEAAGAAGRARRWRSSTSIPNVNVRKLYAGEVATQIGLPVADLVRVAERRDRGARDRRCRPAARVAPCENAEFVAIALLAQDWDAIARGWSRRCSTTTPTGGRSSPSPSADGDLAARDRRSPTPRPARCSNGPPSPTSSVDPGGRGAQPDRRRRAPGAAAAVGSTATRAAIRDDREARLQLEELAIADAARSAAAEWLLGWLASSDGGTQTVGPADASSRRRAAPHRRAARFRVSTPRSGTR